MLEGVTLRPAAGGVLPPSQSVSRTDGKSDGLPRGYFYQDKGTK